MKKEEAKILVMEDQALVSYDLQMSFRRKGFLVISEVDLNSLLKTKNEFLLLVISMKTLQKRIDISSFKNYYLKNKKQFISTTDTLILNGKMDLIKTFSKPFDPQEIIGFVTRHLAENPELVK